MNCPFCKPTSVIVKDASGKDVREFKHDTINYAHPQFGAVYTPTNSKPTKPTKK